MQQPAPEKYVNLLQQGELSPQGKFLWGSNYTLLLEVSWEDLKAHAVYKPVRGERPLWDFPASSLAGREVSAYLISQALGWNLVPPTVYRREGPQGPGSLQLFIHHDPKYHYFNFSGQDRQRLRPVVLFDLLINNADRKGSHILIDEEENLWLIDHGICFHKEYKLRTVVWDFAGEPYPDPLCQALASITKQLLPGGQLRPELAAFLDHQEIAALTRRAENLLAVGHFPEPMPDFRPYPWPPV